MKRSRCRNKRLSFQCSAKPSLSVRLPRIFIDPSIGKHHVFSFGCAALRLDAWFPDMRNEICFNLDGKRKDARDIRLSIAASTSHQEVDQP
jgi:hypothetical protein